MEKQTAQAIARTLMNEHGLHDWSFKFDRATSRFGLCTYTSKTISLSGALTELNPESDVRDVILHEIAHALVGAGHGHGAIWRAKAREIGNTGARTHNSETPKGRWISTCISCGHTRGYHRRPTTERACGVCCRKYNRGKFSSDYLMVITSTV